MANEEIFKYLQSISSDLIIARNAVWGYNFIAEFHGRGQWDDLLVPLQHFMTTAMAIHTRRAFDVPEERHPKRSFRTLSFYLENTPDEVVFDFPWEALNNWGIGKRDCAKCPNGHFVILETSCHACLAKLVGRFVRTKCGSLDKKYPHVKKFRDEWVAHAGITSEPIKARYSDILTLLDAGEELLSYLARCFGMVQDFNHIESRERSHRFNEALRRMLEQIDGPEDFQNMVAPELLTT